MGVEIDSCQNTPFHHGFPTIFLLLVFRYWTTTRQGTTENKTGWQRLPTESGMSVEGHEKASERSC